MAVQEEDATNNAFVLVTSIATAAPPKEEIARDGFCQYSRDACAMKYLTKEQQKVLAFIIFLLLTGLAVKTWRTMHPPKTTDANVKVSQ